MRPDPPRCNVNILGAWNQAIFSPDWVASRLFQISPTEIVAHYKFSANLIFSEFTALGSKKLPVTMRVMPTQVLIFSDKFSRESLEQHEALAIRLLSVLRDTPIQAFGFNLGFASEDMSYKFQSALDTPDVERTKKHNYVIDGLTVVRSVVANGLSVNVHVERDKHGAVELIFNHHFPVVDASAALKLLEGIAERSWTLSAELAKAMYGVNLR